MPRALVVSCFLLTFFIAVEGTGNLLRAEEPKESKKVKVHEGAQEVKGKIFDLADPSQAENLAEWVKKGEIEHLEPDKPVNILDLKWDLSLWTLVVFGLLYFVLRKWAWKPMLEGLQKREENIRSAVEEAQRARDEAQRLRDQLQREVDKAHEKVRDILDQARRDAQHMTEEMVAKARAEIQADRDRLRREIETARDQALQDLWNRTAQLATMISAKAIRRQLTPEDHRRLVDEALAELGMNQDSR